MVVPYTSEHKHGVEAIYLECFPSPYTLQMLQHRINQNTSISFVYIMSKEVVGYVITTINNDKPYITQVAVKGDSRGFGIGSELMRAAEECYPSGSLIWLETEIGNPAQKLYFDLGYRVREFRKNLYGTGKDGIAMYKVL